jgi:endoglucanase
MNVSEYIHINQIGYRQKDEKIALIHGQGGHFEVIDSSNGEIVHTGEAIRVGEHADPSSGDILCSADFTAIERPGRYRVSVPGVGSSYVFAIAEQPYQELTDALLKSFYFQRCGMALEEDFAGVWKHDACHCAEGHIYGTPHVKDSAGGWHDAGDYGKYTVPAAKAVADLLLAYEWSPVAFERPLLIPESHNGVPDLLNECRYELEWLFKMQNAESGGAYHKLTTLRFPGLDVMPEHDTKDLYFMPISAAATGDFAAVMAMASRVYKPFDEAFASRCIKAAIHAWEWLERHPEEPGFRNPPDVATGEYGDQNDRDERYWAASELFRTTGEGKYGKSVIEILNAGGYDPMELGWADVGGYGTIAYLMNEHDSRDDAAARNLLKLFTEAANRIAANSKQDGYGISLQPGEYKWGSNMNVMNNAMHLIIAQHFHQDEQFIQAAHDHLHYILGRNALNICHVTGFGSNPIMHPHHRPSVGDGIADPVPGMLSGGPNSGLQDDVAREKLQGQPPARCFVDHKDSYSTNEMTIYWNSPAVFVCAFFENS